MHLPIHLVLTGALIVGAKKLGYNVSNEIALAAITGGVLINLDKILEVIANKKNSAPDITARCRILHSALAIPFGLILCLIVSSLLPLFAVISHIAADSFIPSVVLNGKHYPSHSRLKWLILPWPKNFWHKTVVRGWPLTYEAKFNWIYTELSQCLGLTLLILTVFLIFLPKIILYLLNLNISVILQLMLPLIAIVSIALITSIIIEKTKNDKKWRERGNGIFGVIVLFLWLVYFII